MPHRISLASSLHRHAPRSVRVGVLCILACLPLSITTHAQDTPDDSPKAVESSSIAAPANSSSSSSTQSEEPSTQELHTLEREEDERLIEDESASPIQLPHIFFDNRLNPIDYLGREIDLENDGPGQITGLTRENIILREDLESPREIRRRYALVTHRTTKISYRNRVHELDDELRQSIDIAIIASAEDHPSDVLRIVVRHMEPAYGEAAAPLNVAIPRGGLILDCVQREFQVSCHLGGSTTPILWPQWATLDMSDWFSRRALTPESRWRRTLPHPEVLGWRDGINGRMHGALQILESGPSSGEDSTHVQGAIDGKVDLRVYHRMETMPLEGQVDVEFDHNKNLVRRLVWQWDGNLLSDGLLNGHRYKWERRTAAILRVTTNVQP